jgi:hypothetical protein
MFESVVGSLVLQFLLVFILILFLFLGSESRATEKEKEDEHEEDARVGMFQIGLQQPRAAV